MHHIVQSLPSGLLECFAKHVLPSLDIIELAALRRTSRWSCALIEDLPVERNLQSSAGSSSRDRALAQLLYARLSLLAVRAWKELVDNLGRNEWIKGSAAYLSPAGHALIPADDPTSGAAVQQALRRRAGHVTNMVNGHPRVVQQGTALDKPLCTTGNPETCSFQCLLHPGHLGQWLEDHATLVLGGTAKRPEASWPAVAILHAPDPAIKLLIHRHADWDTAIPFNLEVAAISCEPTVHVLACKTLPMYGQDICPNTAQTAFAWRSSPSGVTVTSMLDLAAVVTILLDADPQPCPATDWQQGIFYDIVWSVDEVLLAVFPCCRAFPLPIGTESTCPKLYICQAASREVLHSVPLAAPFFIHRPSFSPDHTLLAFFGMPAGTGHANAQHELFVYELTTGEINGWHWAHWTTPEPSICDSISWGADGSWLIAEIMRPPGWEPFPLEEVDVYGNYDGDLDWRCVQGDVITGMCTRLDDEGPRVRILLESPSGRIVHVWQAFDPPDGCELIPCEDGFIDMYRRQRMYIGKKEELLQKHGLRHDRCEPMPAADNSELQVMLGPGYKISVEAVFSPDVTMVVDLSKSEYASTLYHLCLSTQLMHAILMGWELTHGGLADLAWMPFSPRRLIYALPMADFSVMLVDATKHSILHRWSPSDDHGHHQDLSA